MNDSAGVPPEPASQPEAPGSTGNGSPGAGPAYPGPVKRGHKWLIRVGIGVIALIVVVWVARIASEHAKPVANPNPLATAALVATNCQPVWVSGNQMIFNKVNPGGHWDAYIGNTSCQNATPLLPPTPGHRGATSVTPNGRYVLFETDFGNPPGQSDAEPGKGVGDELVLLDRQSGQVTQLTHGALATIWGQLNSTGTMVTWSQMIKTPSQSGNVKSYLLGIWQLHEADITAQGTLTNQKVWAQPNDQGFVETYGWYGNNIMFASDAGVEPKNPLGNWLSSQDWMISDTLPTGASAARISQPIGGKNYYHEFMTVAPPRSFNTSDPSILTSILYESNGGMDLWRMNPNGSGLQRLTYFNGSPSHPFRAVAGFPAPSYSVVGQVVVDQNNPKVIYAGVSHKISTSSIDMYKIWVR